MDKEYFDEFEHNIEKELLETARSLNVLAAPLPLTDDFFSKWAEFAPSYFADAVPEIAKYPIASIAWAGYVGMAVAYWWDYDWELHKDSQYSTLYGRNGFDDMDEHIAFELLKLDDGTAKTIEDVLRICAETAVTMIRHENIEPQTTDAFYVYARVVKVMFCIGAMIELERLGYKPKIII